MTKLIVPAPQALPLIGRTILLSKFVRESLGFTNQLFQKYGKLASLARGGGTNIYSPLQNCPGTVFTYEVDWVLHGEAPTVEQLQQLPLLERLIKESLRVLPPVPWNARVTSQATSLEGYELPTGTEVWVSIYHTHHSPEIYSQPDKFNPQRWETLEVDNFAYNPFSAGSRKCIGAGFVMMEIKIVLAMLLQKFRFQCLPKQKIQRHALIVLAAKGGLPMLVCQQDREFSQGVGGLRGNIRELLELE